MSRRPRAVTLRAGARLLLADIDGEAIAAAAEEARETGRKAVAQEVDVGSGPEVADMVAKTVETSGRLDVTGGGRKTVSTISRQGTG